MRHLHSMKASGEDVLVRLQLTSDSTVFDGRGTFCRCTTSGQGKALEKDVGVFMGFFRLSVEGIPRSRNSSLQQRVEKHSSSLFNGGEQIKDLSV